MLLDATDRSLELVLGAAHTTTALSVSVDYVDETTTALPAAGLSPSNSNGTTPVTILVAPLAATRRVVRGVSVFNADTVSQTVTISYNVATVLYPIVSILLAANDTLAYSDVDGWYVQNSNGRKTYGVVYSDPLKMDVSVYDTDADGIVDDAEAISYIVRNDTAGAMTKGQVVYVSGATGQTATVALAKADAEATSAGTIGVLAEDIAINATGQVIMTGRLENFDTSAFLDGDVLYLSGATAGGLTSTKPASPSHMVVIGHVAYSHATSGKLLVRVDNRYELDELHNVLITTVADKDALEYEAATSLWKNVGQREAVANKDVSGGYVGKTLEKINFWNTARTFMSFFTNAATAVRTWTFPDKDGTVAMTNDKLSAFAATTSAELAGVLSDETGTGGGFVRATGATVSGMLSAAKLAAGSNTLALADAQFVNEAIAQNKGRLQQAIDLTYASSGSSGFQIADHASLNMGTNNFGYHGPKVALPDYTPAAVVTLQHKHDGTNGEIFTLQTNGKVRLQINSNTYDSTVATGLEDYTPADLGYAVQRETATADGEVRFFANGQQIGDAVVITAAATVTVSNTSTMYIMGTSAASMAGRVYSLGGFYNRKLSAAQERLRYMSGINYSDIGARQTELATNGTFTGSAAGWTLGAGWAYGTNNIVATAAAANTTQIISGLSSGKRYRVSITVSGYVSGTVRINVGGFTPATSISSDGIYISEVLLNPGSTTTFYIQVVSAFTGTVDDISCVEIGATSDHSIIQPTQIHDSGVAENHASFPAAGATLTQFKETGQWNSVANITADTTFSLPAGWALESVLCEETAGNAVDVRLGTTAGGTDIFAATTVPASSFKPIQAPYAFSRTAAKTLYFSSAAWSSASLKVTLYLRRIS